MALTVPCTPDEHRLVVGGATQLVVEGDQARRCIEQGHLLYDCHLVAPQRWVDATGPCPTCEGTGTVGIHEGCRHPNSPEHRCPDCIDGRKRVAFAVTCPNRHAFRGGWADCVRCDDHGQIVFAHATVEVLPVVNALEACRPRTCLGYPHCDGVQCTAPEQTKSNALLVTRGPCWLNLNGVAHCLELDPLPVPGRDFVVLLDNVEMT